MRKYQSSCVRRVGNWSFIKKAHKFDKPNDFNKAEVLSDAVKYSPKVVALLKNIEEQDEKDMAAHGKHFKHFIFSEVKQGGYGVKILTAALLAKGFNLGFDRQIKVLSDDELMKSKGNNMLLLSSTAVYNKALTVKAKNAILSKFNQRPENVNGDLARIILLDSGFKEGIDLFDVKYVHIFEPQTSKADQKQVIGRATRLCGQKGLEFHPKYGWPLEVFLYDVTIPSELSEGYGASSLFDMFLKYSGIDQRKLAFADELEKFSMVGAVDYELTRNVHRFVLEEESVDLQWLFPRGGALKQRPEIVACDKKCSKRPTKDVPLSLPLFITVLFATQRELPDLRKSSNARTYLCEMLKNDKDFCVEANKAWADPVLYVKKHKDVLIEAISTRKQGHLPMRNRQPFLNFVFKIIGRPASKKQNPFEKSAKTVPTQNTLQGIASKTISPQSINAKVQEDIIPLPTPVKDDVVLTPPKAPMTTLNFLEMRQLIRDNYLQYSWPKVRLENMCVPKGGADIVKFTPTQDFVRNYFTPSSAYKGMLLWHSVGTGKTCSAIATASSSFESEGYTILWVTRTTLKSDIYKNMFEQVCSIPIQEKMKAGFNMPANQSERMNLLSKSWNIRPMSYKQFSNLVSGKNKLYNDLVLKNGDKDPLRKTLLIIDEAHKLYGGTDLSAIERPDMSKLHKSIMHSYKTSGDDSVRVILMTATPITNDPMELIKLLNLCRLPKDQFSVDYDEFAKEFMVDDTGKFSKKSTRTFLDSIAGYISYLSREKDARQFSQPVITKIEVPLSLSTFNEAEMEKIDIEFGNQSAKVNDEVENLTERFTKFKNEVAQKKKNLKSECVGLKKQDKKDCLNRVSENILTLNDELFDKKVEVDKQKQTLKNSITELKKQTKQLLDEAKNDKSQQGVIENKCRTK